MVMDRWLGGVGIVYFNQFWAFFFKLVEYSFFKTPLREDI